MTESATWISAVEAASLLKISRATVLRRAEKGTLPARRSPSTPFTEDGRENYEINLDSLSENLRYQYHYANLPDGEKCAIDLISPRSALGNVWLSEFVDVAAIIRETAETKRVYRGTRRVTGELKRVAQKHGISLATLYRLTGKRSAVEVSLLYTDPFYLQDHLPSTMCLWSCDLAFALFMEKDKKYSQNDITEELIKLRNSVPCTDCPYAEGEPRCAKTSLFMLVPNHRKTVNRLLQHVPPEMVLLARRGYREWRAHYGLFVVRNPPILINESWQGDHHTFDLFVRITVHKERKGRIYEKEIAVRPTLTAWLDSATGCFVGWVISVMPNSDTIADAFCRAAVLTLDTPFHGLPKSVIVDCGKDYKSKLLEDIPPELSNMLPTETELNKRFAGLGLLPALGCEVHHAMPYHPQSKPIERYFGILETKWVSKLVGWCGNSPQERPPDFQKKLSNLLKEKKLLTLEEFSAAFQEKILPEYHNLVIEDPELEMEGWSLSLASMSPMQRYQTLERVKTSTPDWPTISILKLHHSSDHKVGRWGVRLQNAYYQADELAPLVGQKVDILFHKVQPPLAPASITVVHNNHFVCEAFPAESRHLTDDSPSKVALSSERQNRPAAEMHRSLARIRRSAKAIMPEGVTSGKAELYDLAYGPAIEQEVETEEEIQTSRAESAKEVQAGLDFLFGNDQWLV